MERQDGCALLSLHLKPCPGSEGQLLLCVGLMQCRSAGQSDGVPSRRAARSDSGEGVGSWG